MQGKSGGLRNLILFVQLTRPLFLLGAGVLYALGAGISHYLGEPINWPIYALGQGWVTLCQLCTHYLNEYYNSPADVENRHRTLLSGGSGAIGRGKLPRHVPLIAAFTSLTALTSLTVILIANLPFNPSVYVVMGLAFLGAFFYSSPPVRLESSGYGELSTSVMVGFLVPFFAYILQAGEPHPLLAMIGFPLVTLHMAMLLALELPDYSTDLKHNKRTLLIRVGWQTGMQIHNTLILASFLLVLLARLFGFPWFAMIAGLLPLPLGLYQIWQMRRIADGAKPNWNILTITAVSSFGCMAYFIAFAFWTN